MELKFQFQKSYVAIATWFSAPVAIEVEDPIAVDDSIIYNASANIPFSV